MDVHGCPYTIGPMARLQYDHEIAIPNITPYYSISYHSILAFYQICIYQVLQSDLVWTYKWPFQGLSDLHLGYQRVTLKKLVYIYIIYIYIHTYKKLSCIYMYTCVVCVCVLFGMQVTSTYLSLPIRKFKSCLGKVAWFHLFEPHLLEEVTRQRWRPINLIHTAWVLKKVLPDLICI